MIRFVLGQQVKIAAQLEALGESQRQLLESQQEIIETLQACIGYASEPRGPRAEQIDRKLRELLVRLDGYRASAEARPGEDLERSLVQMPNPVEPGGGRVRGAGGSEGS